MKKYIAYIIGIILLVPVTAGAIVITFPFNGGTGNSGLPAYSLLVGNGYSPTLSTSSPTVGYITATSTTATSTFYGGVAFASTTATTTAANGISLSNGCYKVTGSCLTIYMYSSFTYATSTWSGTTTIPLEVGFGEKWDTIQCFTDAGTVYVDAYHASSHLNSLQASTTVGTFTYTTNNTITGGDKTYVDLGTPATAPGKITCTVKKHIP